MFWNFSFFSKISNHGKETKPIERILLNNPCLHESSLYFSIPQDVLNVISFYRKYLIILSNHRIITIGEINRKIRRKNFKNNCLNSILTLCFSIHGFVTIQTTIRHIAPTIAILIHIYCLFHINFSQIQTFYFHRQEYC